jgi:hypothetical protein
LLGATPEISLHAAMSSSPLRDFLPNNNEMVPKKTYLELCSSEHFLHYQEPPGTNMVGQYHIQKGAYSMLVGPTGSNKSLGVTDLAVKAINGKGSWFDLPIHGRFRVLILQAENSCGRISRNLKQLEHLLPKDHREWLFITAPPKYGMPLEHEDFRGELKNEIDKVQPHLFIVVPVNAVIPDQMARDFHNVFNWFGEVLADCSENVGRLFVHHLRKVRADDHVKGRAILNLVSGSLLGISVPRTVMILQHASDDLSDRRVVFATHKNNDGIGWQGDRSAWELRDDGLFHKIADFDFEVFDGKQESKITLEHVRTVFSGGQIPLGRKDAMRELVSLTKVHPATAYKALEIGGRFSAYLSMTLDGRLAFSEPDPNQHHLDLSKPSI